MEYYEAVNRLEQLRRLGPKLGTETVAALLEHLDSPHGDLTAVQIAGSNGKGSTASVLGSICREAGLNVGVYTSPDLNDFRERIRVGGQKIPKQEVVTFVEETWPYIRHQSAFDDAPTFFEAVTALALWHFDREDVDLAVLEVGIGGQYDATSVVDPVASAVTTVSLEHTDILGETVEEIARDKAHVAPADRPLVTGATGDALDAIRGMTDVVTVAGVTEIGTKPSDTGEEQPTADVQATESEMVSATESALSLVGPGFTVETRTPLPGRHQAVNAGVASALARQVTDATEEEIALGIRNVTWPGRFELMDRDPLVVLDGAHNPGACEQLATLLDRFEYGDLKLVFGAMRDKDHAAMCRALPAIETCYLAKPDVERAEATDVLASLFDRETDATVRQTGSVLAALERALDDAEGGDLVLVTGSLFTVAEARDRWTRVPVEVETDTRTRAGSVLRDANIPHGERAANADRLVTRTVRLHARQDDAATLRNTMLSLGGYCTVSGIEAAHEHVTVVLAGTRPQYRQLVDRLREQGDGVAQLAGQLQAQFDSTDEPSGGYPWEDETAVMGILNVTPDSFHDGGEYLDHDAAIAHAREMVESGADIVDIGGESTRPGADPVSVATERDRVVPVVDSLSEEDVLLSVDTRKPRVAAAALEAGADMVNDVTGLTDARMRRVVSDWDVPAVVTHIPVDPDRQHRYDDVVAAVLSELTERIIRAERAGIDRSQLLVDPGLGFGKCAGGSFELLDRIGEFGALGTPLLVGHSRKSMFGSVSEEDRLAPTLAATALAVDRGADVVRVHDVPENVAAVATAVRTAARETRTK
jgi:dihydropteroate synthase